MKRTVFLLFTIGPLACKKEIPEEVPFVPSQEEKYRLKGLYTFDNSGTPILPSGNPDDVFLTDSVRLNVYLNYNRRSYDFLFSTVRRHDSVFTYTIAHAVYPNAPDSFYLYKNHPVDSDRIGFPMVVANQTLTGKEIIRQAITVPTNVTYGRTTGAYLDLGEAPKGFYRLFIESNTGAKFQVGLYNYKD